MSSYREKNPPRCPVEPAAGWRPGFAGVAVMPVYDENELLPETLDSLHRALNDIAEPVAVLLAVNQPWNAPDAARKANERLLDRLRHGDKAFFGGLEVGRNLFFMALSESDFEQEKSGVGGARKAGMDAALAVIDGKVTESDGWLFSLDADAPVAENYFRRALDWGRSHPDWAGAIFHFEHRLPEAPELRGAVAAYELYLREYAAHCRKAGSHYGFWALGSAFMANVRHYERAGGMRRRTGGEDFYFLQALRKVGKIGVVPDTAVYPSGRPSERVPFGTGPAVRKLAAGAVQEFYHPDCFAELAGFYHGIASHDYAALSTGIDWIESDRVRRYLLTEADFAAVWPRMVRNTPKNAPALREALHCYADGFFILKFCHWLEATEPERFARVHETGDIASRLAAARRRDRALEFL